MSAGNLKIKLRPLRLAFIVDPQDKASVLDAIRICSFLWGGAFNPIIPLFRRFTKRERFVHHGANRQDVINGYIEAFDPDFIVLTGSPDTSGFDFGPRQKVNSTDILKGIAENGTPQFGIGLFEILQRFVNSEFKFVRRVPLQLQIPRIAAGRDQLFLASVFGMLSQSIESELLQQLQEFPDLVVREEVSLKTYAEMIAPSNLFVRRLGNLDIKPRRHWHHQGDCVFFLDANSTADVLDYWNLRALGWNVVPICRQVSTETTVRALAEQFVNENAYALRGNRDIYNTTTFLPSGSTTMKELEKFGSSLQLEPSKHKHDWKFSYQWWFPRIWDEWAREKDGATPCDFDVASEEQEIAAGDDSISFKSLMPVFARRFGGHGKPRCANDLSFRLWSQQQVFAEAIPEGDHRLASAAGALGWDEWRCSQKGLVHLPIHKDWREHMRFPLAERVFESWLRAREWEAKLSDKGHIARQILKQTGGYWGLSLIALPGMVELLDRITREGVLRAGALRSQLSQIAKTDEYHLLEANKLLQRLIEQHVIQLGLFLQCPTCRQRSWYSVGTADYQLDCPKCLESFPLPAPSAIRWAYRTLGPFSLPRRAYGAYAVLLALRFFSRLLDAATTPMLSFTATRKDKCIEVDLGLFMQRMHYGTLETDLLFAECKTFSAFERSDVDKMAAVSREFPGAVIVFATLRGSLKESERRLLRPLVNRGRRYWKTDRPYNPVLILTGNELLTEKNPRSQWEKLGGQFAVHSRRWGDQRELVSLADATQQIYLGMQPWHTWLEERYNRKRRPKPGQDRSTRVSESG